MLNLFKSIHRLVTLRHQCMRSATAPAVCMFVENQIFNLFGVPAICITDNAKVFKSDAFAKLLKTYDVTHWNLAVYHPSPNPVERVNRVIVTAIRCSLHQQKDHREWDRSIHQIAQAIRTTVHDSTGHTPFFINFGRNMISSGAEYDFLRKSEDAARCPLKLSEEMKQLFGIVRQNLMKAYQKYSRTYNLRANAKHNFEPGHIVFKKNINLSDKSRDYVGKLASKFTRVRVKEKVGTNSYILESLDGKRISGVYHGSFLKRA